MVDRLEGVGHLVGRLGEGGLVEEDDGRLQVRLVLVVSLRLLEDVFRAAVSVFEFRMHLVEEVENWSGDRFVDLGDQIFGSAFRHRVDVVVNADLVRLVCAVEGFSNKLNRY